MEAPISRAARGMPWTTQLRSFSPMVKVHGASSANLRERVATALQGAIANAIVHGDLEMPSMAGPPTDRFRAYVDERLLRLASPLARRHVNLGHRAERDAKALRMIVADKGPGFARVDGPYRPEAATEPNPGRRGSSRQS